jgi:choline dehydrogenase-like flavoprotein
VIADLNNYEPSTIRRDIAIVGGGIAGLLLAIRLQERGKSVVVLESGGMQQLTETHPFNRVVQLGDIYRGAEHGRFRCLGGTSSRWGGALLPFNESDLASRGYVDLPGWPLELSELTKHLTAVEKLFGLCDGSFDEQFVSDIGAGRFIPTGDEHLIARFAKWPSFGKRNIFNLLRARLDAANNVDVLFNATATEFRVDTENGKLMAISAQTESRKSIEVFARQFAICAGAIESTRLLLLLDAQYSGKLFASHDVLGRYFHDHVSIPAAEIQVKQTDRLNQLAGFRFVGSTMRSLRYELSPKVQRLENVGSAFGHIAFEALQESGFDALRTLLRGVQQRQGIRLESIGKLISDLPYLAKLGYWRLIHKQLRWPTPAKYQLHVVVEQLPIFKNRILLSEEKDVFGLELAAIDWRVSESDHRTRECFQKYFSNFWQRRQLDAIGDLVWKTGDDYRGEDIFHPGGSTRMGLNARTAVVDKNLHTFAVPNLSVASTSVFPSGASANPTLMLMLFVERLAIRLATDSH